MGCIEFVGSHSDNNKNAIINLNRPTMAQLLTTRRHLLRQSLYGGVLVSALPLSAETVSPISNWQSLQDKIHLLTYADSNICVIEGEKSLCLVDGGAAAYGSITLQAIKQKYPGKKPQLLFNTHWHHQQIGCNASVGEQQVPIIAHENTKLWLSTEVISSWENKTYSPLPQTALPNTTFFYDEEELNFTGIPIEYGYLPQAHTDGDMYVYLPEQNVFLGGGVISGNHLPLVDYVTGGWIGGMINALKLVLSKIDNQTIVVPARGKACSKKEVEQQLALCESLIVKIARNYYSGLTYKDFIQTNPLADYSHFSGGADVFLHTAYEGAWWHIRELRRWARRS